MRSYRERLIDYHPKGFESYVNWQQVMVTWVVSDEIGKLRKRSGIGSFVRAIKEAFCNRYYYEKSGGSNAKTMFFYGRYNYRRDHYNTFSNFVANFKDSCCMKAIPCTSCINIWRGLKLLGLMWTWFFQALRIGVNVVQAANVVYPLTLCYLLKDDLEKILSNTSIKLFITYYDVSPDENFAVQVAKHYGKLTATLQHGIFSKKVPCKVLSDTAFEYSESIADYYLAWNQYTYDEWKKIGLPIHKIKVLGIPKYINLSSDGVEITDKKNIFGIMLNNSSFKEHNIRLITMGNEYARRTGMKYVLRYHPELKTDAYQDFIDEKCFHGKSDNSMTIEEYAKTVDFTIISSSSVFVDLIYLNYPVYRLEVFDNDTYSDVKFNAFSTIDELNTAMQEDMNNKKVFDYLCTTHNIKDFYQEFIDNIVKD